MIPADFFDRMPVEVREMWLEPCAAEYGWPFQSLGDSTEIPSGWSRLLSALPLREINELRWSLEQVDFASQPFLPGNRECLLGLVQEHALGRKSQRKRRVIRSKERFWNCVDFVRANRTLPAPPILVEVFGVMEILDGHHRLAAFALVAQVRAFTDLKILAWIARRTKEDQRRAEKMMFGGLADKNRGFIANPSV